MKNSISNMLSFILMSILVFTIVFVVYEISIRGRILFKKIENINYYDKAYETINSKLDDFIINSDINKAYKAYISKELVKNDINYLINESYGDCKSVSRYDEFYKIIKKYTNDENVMKIYSTKIDEIYSNNLVPVKELSYINSFYKSTSSVLFTMILLMTICLIFVVLLFFINKNIEFLKSVLLGTATLCIIPFFIKLFGLFDGFLYTNSYYTDLLVGIINAFVNILFIISVCIFVILIIKQICSSKICN